MKGIVKKLDDGWAVLHTGTVEGGELWYEVTPINPDQIDGLNEGDEVDFTVVNEMAKIYTSVSIPTMEHDSVVEPVEVKKEKPTNKLKNLMNTEIKINVPKISFDVKEFKHTLMSLNNVFYGSMIFMCIFVLYLLFYAYSFYFLLVPLGYIAVCYVGKFTKPYLKKVFRDESVS